MSGTQYNGKIMACEENLKIYKLDQLPNYPIGNAILFIRNQSGTAFDLYVTTANGTAVPLNTTQGITQVTSPNGSIDVNLVDNLIELEVSQSLIDLINGALQIGGNISDLLNDAEYITDAPQDGNQYVREDGQWVEVAIPSTLYDGNSPSTRAIENLPIGTDLTTLTLTDLLENIYAPFVAPTFSAFSITGQATTIEVGTDLSGNKTFTWATTNASNISPNTIQISNQTDAQVLATGLANDGSEVLNIGTVATATPRTINFQIQATNTQSNNFNRLFSVVTRRRQFFGSASAIPANSAQVRALASNNFDNVNVFTLATGTTNVNFVVAIPATKSITSVIDLGNLNLDVTSQYVLINSSFTVNDIAGNAQTYKLYAMTLSAPYPTSTNHQITTA